jgi:hypothetical protein
MCACKKKTDMTESPNDSTLAGGEGHGSRGETFRPHYHENAVSYLLERGVLSYISVICSICLINLSYFDQWIAEHSEPKNCCTFWRLITVPSKQAICDTSVGTHLELGGRVWFQLTFLTTVASSRKNHVPLGWGINSNVSAYIPKSSVADVNVFPYSWQVS